MSAVVLVPARLIDPREIQFIALCSRKCAAQEKAIWPVQYESELTTSPPARVPSACMIRLEWV